MKPSTPTKAELCMEIDALKKENARLRDGLAVFVGDKQYYCIEDGHGCYHDWHPAQHIEGCPVRVAWEALNPEPAP